MECSHFNNSVNFSVSVLDPVQPSNLTGTEVALVHNGEMTTETHSSKFASCFKKLTNRMWFSVVCTLLKNDVCHHSGQNVVDSRGATKRNLCQHLFTIKNTDSDLKVHVQHYANQLLLFHCATHWCEQRGMGSYWQWQISQSDCDISSNWGKKSNRAHNVCYVI